MLFDGINDYVRVLDAPALNFGVDQEFTASFWIKGIAGTPIDKRGNVGFQVQNTLFRIDEGAANIDVSYVSNPLNNQWHFISAIRSFSAVSLYVDGALDNSVSDSTLANLTDPENLFIGCLTPCVSGPFNGLIDDVRLYNRALAFSEIKAIYDATK